MSHLLIRTIGEHEEASNSELLYFSGTVLPYWSTESTLTRRTPRELFLLHVVQPHLAGTDQQISVEKLRLYHHVTVQHLGGHHLALRRGLYQGLPGVGGVGDDETEVEVPLLQAPALEEHFLLQAEFLHGLHRGEVDLPGDGAALQDLLGHPRLVLRLGHRQVVVTLPEYLASIGVPQVHPVDPEPPQDVLRLARHPLSHWSSPSLSSTQGTLQTTPHHTPTIRRFGPVSLVEVNQAIK